MPGDPKICPHLACVAYVNFIHTREKSRAGIRVKCAACGIAMTFGPTTVTPDKLELRAIVYPGKP